MEQLIHIAPAFISSVALIVLCLGLTEMLAEPPPSGPPSPAEPQSVRQKDALSR